jgi:hypothetical protein
MLPALWESAAMIGRSSGFEPFGRETLIRGNVFRAGLCPVMPVAGGRLSRVWGESFAN